MRTALQRWHRRVTRRLSRLWTGRFYSAALLSLPLSVFLTSFFSDNTSSLRVATPPLPFLVRGFVLRCPPLRLVLLLLLVRPLPDPPGASNLLPAPSVPSAPEPRPHMLKARCVGGVREARLSNGQAPGRGEKGRRSMENAAPGGWARWRHEVFLSAVRAAEHDVMTAHRGCTHAEVYAA